MLDYLALQGSSENPTFVTIIFTVLLAFSLSSLIAWTFDRTTEMVLVPVAYLQSLVLVSIVAATVMQAIGDSLARGLGMLGALAIIRFRTTLKTPRNMVFTFASLAAGISCGVFGFTIGIVGTVSFCVIAFILRYSPWHVRSNSLIGILKFEFPKSSTALSAVESILTKFCKRHSKIRYQFSSFKNKNITDTAIEKSIIYEYHLNLKSEADATLLHSAISDLENIRSVKFNFEQTPENV